MKLAEDKTITVEGVVLVQKDADGEVHGRPRPATTWAARAPRSAAASASSSACSRRRCWPRPRSGRPPAPWSGKFAKHRLESGIGEKMDAALPPGSGGVIADLRLATAHDAVDAALANAVKKSVAQIDGTSAKELKAGLAEAQAGMGG